MVEVETKIKDSLGRPLRPGNIVAIVEMPDVTIWTLLGTQTKCVEGYNRLEICLQFMEHNGKQTHVLYGWCLVDDQMMFYYDQGYVLKLSEGEGVFFA
jgi:hypothetical protein